MLRLLWFALLATTPLLGCAHHRLVVPEPVPATGYHARTSHAFFWGFSEPRIVATECSENALSEVRVVTSLPHALAATATLGLWMPLKVEYKCGKRPLQEGTLGDVRAPREAE